MVLALEAVPQERAEAACRRALHFGNLRPKAIERILEEGLDQEPLPAEPVVEPTPGRFARDLQALAASACARGVA